jgi:YebC/PmpR family DNA-binding regulatory protein
MSRHSKWSKVKQFKGAVDAKRAASFTKLARELTVATREKGPDPAFNVRLRVAIERAKKGLMPKENIERAVKRGSGEGDKEGGIEELWYEAYGPSGSALIIECLTDNRNRAVADVKHILTKKGARLAEPGSVTHLFDRKGVIRIQDGIPADKREDAELELIDAGALDITDDESAIEIQTQAADLMKIAEVAEKLGLNIESANMEWIPKMLLDVAEDTGMKVEEIIEALEELDDVQRVYSNLA